MSGSFSGAPFNGSHRGVRVVPYTNDRMTDPSFKCNQAFPGLVMLGHTPGFSDMVEGQCIFTMSQKNILKASINNIRILGVVREPIHNGELAHYNPNSCGVTSVVMDGVMSVCVADRGIKYGDLVGIKGGDPMFCEVSKIKVNEDDYLLWGGMLCANVVKVTRGSNAHILGRAVDCSNINNGEILVDLNINNYVTISAPAAVTDTYLCNTIIADPPVQPVYAVVTTKHLDNKKFPKNIPVFTCGTDYNHTLQLINAKPEKEASDCKFTGVLVEGKDRGINVVCCRGTMQIYIRPEDLEDTRPGDPLGFDTGNNSTFIADIDGHTMTIPRPVLVGQANQSMMLWNYLGGGVAIVVLNAP